LINFRGIGDQRGHLTVLEEGTEIPFSVQRIYYLTATIEGVSRGFHAHKMLEQVAVCVAGSCEMVLDDGLKRETILLDSSDTGVYIGNLVWREMHDFSKDCVLLVLANNLYDENDYIRSYKTFLELVKHK